VLDDLKPFGFNMMSFNNNHALDFFYDGLEATLKAADASGLVHAGIGRNLAEASAPKYLSTPKLSNVTSGKSGVSVSYSKVTGATGYSIYRKTGNGGWVKLTTVKGNNKTTYLDKTAEKDITYTYTVRAVNDKYMSSYNAKGITVKDRY
jgi:hypothetical protein